MSRTVIDTLNLLFSYKNVSQLFITNDAHVSIYFYFTDSRGRTTPMMVDVIRTRLRLFWWDNHSIEPDWSFESIMTVGELERMLYKV